MKILLAGMLALFLFCCGSATSSKEPKEKTYKITLYNDTGGIIKEYKTNNFSWNNGVAFKCEGKYRYVLGTLTAEEE